MDKRISSGGLGCTSTIGVVLVVLKCLGIAPVAEWAWAWVLAPFWMPIAAGIVLLLAAYPILKYIFTKD